MEKLVVNALTIVAKYEFQLQNIRQLLGEEVEFIVKQAYKQIACCSFSEQIDLYSLLNFLGRDRNAHALQSVLKFYSNNQLKLNLDDFNRMILSREDKLILKLTKERQNCQNKELPQYLINYCKKLWYLEEQLHEELSKLKAISNHQSIEQLTILNKEGYLDQDTLKTIFLKQHIHSCEQCPQINYQMAIRYLKMGKSQEIVTFETFRSLFISQNCNTIKEYLSSQDQEFKRINTKPKKEKNPYLHKQFQKMKGTDLTNLHFCFREVKSVEDHLKRNKNVHPSSKLKKQINAYSCVVGNALLLFYKKLKKIVKLTQTINQVKHQLLNTYNDVNFQGLFLQIASSNSLVPSELLHYLKGIGVQIKLNDLFILFKKYRDPITGKMTHFHFRKIFLINGTEYSFSEKEEKINPDFRIAAITCILKEIDNQLKIDKLKQQLISEVQLRDLYDSFIPDKKSRVSRTDLQVAVKRGTEKVIGDHELEVFWGRMGKCKDQYINYELFMGEMLPKSTKRSKPSNKTKSSFRL